MTKTYTLNNLPQNIQKILLTSYHSAPKTLTKHRQKIAQSQLFTNKDNDDLFSIFSEPEYNTQKPQPEYTESHIIWATDNYENKGPEYNFTNIIHDVSIIKPRVDKTKTEQKRRIKEKAEVFTPSWVCNIQNNLIDENLLYPEAFNKVSQDQKIWTPTKEKVQFTQEYTWLDYVLQKSLEMCCGEGPYLMSPYDTTTGIEIPVRDSDGLYQRIGILDRKLRVIAENVHTEDFYKYALLAMLSTYGYEWQGDNLLLSRLNFVNTFIEYYETITQQKISEEQLEEVADIASWNLWQMDGLKMVEPMSCSSKCVSCQKKQRTGHDGKVSTIRLLTSQGLQYRNFEDFITNKRKD